MDADTVLLTIGIALIAFLYSTVGHAGASGYIAVMTLAGIAPSVIKPTALALNILVATIATWSFWRARHFDWNLFWPFAITATPLAFIGGYVSLPTRVFKVLVGVVLIGSAIRFLVRPSGDAAPTPPSRARALPVGGALGLLAGLAGNLASTRTFPTVAVPLGVAAIVGGALGAHLGSQRLSHTAIKRTLAIVLLIAGTKLILTR